MPMGFNLCELKSVGKHVGRVNLGNPVPGAGYLTPRGCAPRPAPGMRESAGFPQIPAHLRTSPGMQA